MHSQHQQKWSAPFQPIHSYLLICASVSEFVFKPQRHEPSKERNKSSDWCHSAPPRHTACHRALTAPVGKALCHFLKCHLEGCSCKLHTLLASFRPPPAFSRMVIHSHKKRRRVRAGRIYTGASSENHPRCHSSPFLRRGPDRSAFFPALSEHPPEPFICQQRFCLHLLSVLSQKNKPALICQRSLICGDLGTSRVTRVGGRGVRSRRLRRGLGFNSDAIPNHFGRLSRQTTDLVGKQGLCGVFFLFSLLFFFLLVNAATHSMTQ